MPTPLALPGLLEYDQWRGQVLELLAAKVLPSTVEWIDPQEEPHLWRDGDVESVCEAGRCREPVRSRGVHVPREFPTLARYILCHRSAEKWPLLYRLLWRLSDDRNRGLLLNALDDDVFAARAMMKSVKRDVHKMKAFVRFCRVAEGPRGEHYVAYHRPEHPIVTIAAPFFARRFGVLHWTILTPFGSASWLDGELTFGPAVSRDQAPQPDALEEFWKTYYANIFNPARVNPRAMSKEMPKKYWSTLPEAQIIEQLLADAPVRTGAMIERTIGGPVGGASAFIPAVQSAEPAIALPVLKNAAAACRGCDLYRDATCTVFGEGPWDASIMLVGEQPGDQEDLAGRPFVGPAGQLLDRALADAGIDRGACYVTNAVKHFKWTPAPRGKRRIHAKPSTVEVRACKPWLEAELAAVRPKVVVLLGSIAGQSLMGAGFRVLQSRGKVLRDTSFAPAVVATMHPSAILRVLDEATARRDYDLLVSDLKIVAGLVRR
ncbi:MAG: UdgX family uracil-DNA binding protein [Pyrinomonadaceae bacterium]|nr:UdgX family uracil-DNA binding protein [Phycisphaerales bacterium]